MRALFDPYPSAIFDAVRDAREALVPSGLLWEHLETIQSGSLQRVVDQIQKESLLQHALVPRTAFLNGIEGIGEVLRMHREQDRWRRDAIPQSVLDQVRTAAELTEVYRLPAAIERFRMPVDAMTDKFLGFRGLDPYQNPAYLEAFGRTSALADIMNDSLYVGRGLREAALSFALESIPTFESLVDYRRFLDAAGLRLPRWPRFRLISMAEKRRRFKARLQENVEPPHVKRAKTLVHSYELTLREILDSAMAQAYGEDWAETRLPLCDCTDLLGKWRKRGGDVLDHADYAHYARMMSYSEHFETVFAAGFDDPAALAMLMNDAGRLRAASHHGRTFTLVDLRDLRVVWRTIETGLLAFTSDYEIET